nr:NYN domain-containing protein [Phycisphaerae bacterium]NIT57169.1 NYN domain-containing protein [Fodinibius sp.]NIY25751.1 NYN domain-containing protein [Fodinibius sp.]
IRQHVKVLRAEAFVDTRNSKHMFDSPMLVQDLHQAGINIRHVPKIDTGQGNLKDLVDNEITNTAYWALANLPQVEAFVLGTVDTDFLLMISQLRNADKEVYILHPPSQPEKDKEIRQLASGVIEIDNFFDIHLTTIENGLMRTESIKDANAAMKSWHTRKCGSVLLMAHDILSMIQMIHFDLDLGESEWCAMSVLKTKVHRRLFSHHNRYTEDETANMLFRLTQQGALEKRVRTQDKATEYVLNKSHPLVVYATRGNWEDLFK